MTFVDELKYRKERVGVVKKDGKTYVKYVKTRRFNVSNKVKHLLLGGFVLFVLGLGIKLLISELASGSPEDETAEGIGY